MSTAPLPLPPIPGQVKWDKPTERFHYGGVDRGILYYNKPLDNPAKRPPYNEFLHGEVWNGLTGVAENHEATFTKLPYDGITNDIARSYIEFGGSITAYTYPDVLEYFEGYYRSEKGALVDQHLGDMCGFSWRVMHGDGVAGYEHGYRIHLVWNVMLKPKDPHWKSFNAQIHAQDFKWDFMTVPIRAGQRTEKGFSHMILDNTQLHPWLVWEIERIIYGHTDEHGVVHPPKLPNPHWLLEFIENWVPFRVVDHGDGTWSAISSDADPGEIVINQPNNLFEINWKDCYPIPHPPYPMRGSTNIDDGR